MHKTIARAKFRAILCLSVAALPVFAQQADPKATEIWEPVPKLVTPASEGLPPSDAIILFDGHGLDAWQSADGRAPAPWTVADGVLTVKTGTGNIETRRQFTDFQLHLEWKIPADITSAGVLASARNLHVPEKFLTDSTLGQFRGNSGVFLASTGPGNDGYEVQILDCWQNKTYVNGQAASVYKQAAPLVNACRRPGEWQSYDIVWTAPRFLDNGALASPARVTVFHNGVLVQNNFALTGQTTSSGKPAYRKHGPAPIKLQDHPSVPVTFRNIWVRPLPAPIN